MSDSVSDLQARLAFRALFPTTRRNSSSEQPKEDLRPGARVVISEDFISDSGQQDKVELLQGQRGVVMNVNEAGHVSIDFEDHSKLQWVASRNRHRLQIVESGPEEVVEGSSLRRTILNELNDAMESGFQRRLGRLERRLERLKPGSEQQQQPNKSAGSHGWGASLGQQPTRNNVAGSNGVSTQSLSKVLADVLRTRPQQKAYGPSEAQEMLPNPPEKDEEIVMESRTLSLTLQSLEKNVRSRVRQISSLKDQLDTCLSLEQEQEGSLEDRRRWERALQDSPSAVQAAKAENLDRQRRRVERLASSVEEKRGQAKRYEALYWRQRQYLVQSDRIAMMQAQRCLSNHPTGEVALVPQPLPLSGDECEAWDVGSAVANPYLVDSWPFEPNVLARRTFRQECQMDPLREETQRDLELEERRLPNLIPTLRMPADYGDDDDDEDFIDASPPVGTSRSL